MVNLQILEFDIKTALESKPIKIGHSKHLYPIDEHYCLVKLVPSLSSFTFNRYEDVPGTEVLRLDFYELAAARLQQEKIPVAFKQRVAPNLYVAEFCSEPPFEVIVKNVAVGSTLRKYPNLFPEGHRFQKPIVKFDYRIDPEDQPIAEDYIKEAGYSPEIFKDIALKTNDVLQNWLSPLNLLDFCIIIGRRYDGAYTIISEISPDCMRLKSLSDQSLDKDLFRYGASGAEIISIWSNTIESLRSK